MAYALSITEAGASSAQTITSTRSYSGSQIVNLQESCANSATTELVVAIDVSEISAILIHSTQAVTLKTNDSGTPDETVSIVADVPYIWHTDSYFSNVLETDITSLFITNASGAAATVTVVVVTDATP